MKKTKYIIIGLILILVSYISAVIGSKEVSIALQIWHGLFSPISGISGVFIIIFNVFLKEEL